MNGFIYGNGQVHGEQRGCRSQPSTGQPAAAAPRGLRAKAARHELSTEEAAGGQDGAHEAAQESGRVGTPAEGHESRPYGHETQ